MIEPRRILLVDDEPRTVRRLAQMLRDDGYVVETAIVGAAAIARIAADPLPDVLVTAYKLAHATGVAVARYAKSRNPDMPIVFVTGYPHLIDGAARLGSVFIKPVDYGELAAHLALVVARLSNPGGTPHR